MAKLLLLRSTQVGRVGLASTNVYRAFPNLLSFAAVAAGLDWLARGKRATTLEALSKFENQNGFSAL